MAISPTSKGLYLGQTQQFTQDGAATKWGVRSGQGTISTGGLYTAAARGPVVIRAMTDIWETIDPHLSYAPNNDLTVNDNSDYLFARSYARLTTAGDQIDYDYTAAYSTGVEDTASHFYTVAFGLVYCGTVQYTPSPALTAADVVSFVRIGSNQVGCKINGVLVHTFTQVATGNLRPTVVSLFTSGGFVGAVLKAPRFSGSGITGYTEYTAAVTVDIDPTPYLGDPLVQFVPKAYLEAWHATDKMLVTEDDITLVDISRNSRHVTASGDLPAIEAGKKNGLPAVYFDGTNDPFIYTGAVSCKHLFCVCAYEEEEFGAGEFPGIISDISTYGLLAGEEDSDEFHNFTANGVYGFANSDVGLTLDNAQAPVNGTFAVIELIFPAALPLSGIVIGRDRGNASRKWKGWFLESLIYSEVKTAYDRMLTYRYFAMKYHLWPLNGSGTLNRFPFPSNHTEAVDRVQDYQLSEPYEGEPTALLRGGLRREYQLPFLVRHQAEFQAAEAFIAEHQPLTHFTYRDYRFTPVRDVEGQATSSIKEQGSDTISKFNYSFDFREV